MFKRSHRNIPLIEYKKTLALSLPVIITQAGQIMVGLVDVVMIGHLGSTQLAASSFSNTIFQLVVIFGMGFSFVLTPLVGHKFANRDYLSVGSLLKNGLIANICIGFIMLIIMGIIVSLMPFMNQPVSIVVPSQGFMLLLMLSIIPMQVFYSFKQFFEGVGNTRLSMIIMLLANIINVFVNYMFMYGKLGCVEMGLYGASIGTVVSRIVMAIIPYVCFLRMKSFRRFKLGYTKSRVNLNVVGKLFRLGLPLGGQTVMEASAFGLCTIMMGWINEISLAAHQIALSLSTIGFMVYQGIGAATTIRVSHLIGESNFVKIKLIKTVSIQITFVYCVLIIFLFVSGRNYLPLFFTDDKDVVLLTSGMLVMCGIFQISDGAQIILAGVLRGFADVKMPALITFIAYFMIALPISYVCAFYYDIGAIGMWYGFPIGLTIAYLLYYLRYKNLLKRVIIS